MRRFLKGRSKGRLWVVGCGWSVVGGGGQVGGTKRALRKQHSRDSKFINCRNGSLTRSGIWRWAGLTLPAIQWENSSFERQTASVQILPKATVAEAARTIAVLYGLRVAPSTRRNTGFAAR